MQEIVSQYILSDIQRLQDNQYPFLFIDHATIYDSGIDTVVASASLKPYTAIHWSGCPTVPASLIIESVTQAAGFYMCHRNGFASTHALVVSIEKSLFLRKADGNEDLRVSVTLAEQVKGLFRFRSRVACGDLLIAKINTMMSET